MKQGKQLILSFVLLLVFVTGFGSNMLFAGSRQNDSKCQATYSSQSESGAQFLFFEPLGDNENEENDDNFMSCSIFSLSDLSPFFIYNTPITVSYGAPKILNRCLWRLNQNFRL